MRRCYFSASAVRPDGRCPAGRPLPMKEGRCTSPCSGHAQGHEQYAVAKEVGRSEPLPFDFAIMVGDNITRTGRGDFVKIRDAVQATARRGGQFYAALGNHDDPANQQNYKPFNMAASVITRSSRRTACALRARQQTTWTEGADWFDKELQASDPTGRSCTSTTRRIHRACTLEHRAAQPARALFLKYGLLVVFTDTSISTSGSSHRRHSYFVIATRQSCGKAI